MRLPMSFPEKFIPGMGEPEEAADFPTRPALEDFRPELTFENSLAHKLNYIREAEGSAAAAARAMGIPSETFYDWTRRARTPRLRAMRRIDARYAVAIEKLGLRARRKQARASAIKMRRKNEVCLWSYDEYHCYYDSSCGGAYCFDDGIRPKDGSYRYCPRCGKPVKEVVPEPEDNSIDGSV